jgi:hypothetical protein
LPAKSGLWRDGTRGFKLIPRKLRWGGAEGIF